nr:hypothetical protein CFP56_73886 [Quercus suber]
MEEWHESGIAADVYPVLNNFEPEAEVTKKWCSGPSENLRLAEQCAIPGLEEPHIETYLLQSHREQAFGIPGYLQTNSLASSVRRHGETSSERHFSIRCSDAGLFSMLTHYNVCSPCHPLLLNVDYFESVAPQIMSKILAKGYCTSLDKRIAPSRSVTVSKAKSREGYRK